MTTWKYEFFQLGVRPTEVISTEDVSTQSSWTWIWKFFSPLLFVFYRKKTNKKNALALTPPVHHETWFNNQNRITLLPAAVSDDDKHVYLPSLMKGRLYNPSLPSKRSSTFLPIRIKIWVHSRQTLPSRLINLQSKLNTVWREIQKTKKQKNKNYSPLCSAQMFLAACKPLKHSLWNSVWANSQRRSL